MSTSVFTLRVIMADDVTISSEVMCAPVRTDGRGRIVMRVSVCPLSTVLSSVLVPIRHIRRLKYCRNGVTPHQTVMNNIQLCTMWLVLFSDKNECATNPCSNGAQCVNIDGSYVCNCPTGWTGVLCDIGLWFHTLILFATEMITTDLNYWAINSFPDISDP